MLYVKGLAPPTVEAMADPLQLPLQDTSTILVMFTVKTGALIVSVVVAVHPFAQ